MELLDEIKTTLQKTRINLIAEIANRKSGSVEGFIKLSFHENEQVGFRAAWILEHIYSQSPEQFAVCFPIFLASYIKIENLSAKRHYAKILAFATGKKAHQSIKMRIDETDLEPVVETTFDWLVNDETPVAIKSHCLNILANLIPRYQWIKDDLIQTMDFLVDKESVAFFAKVKQIRKQLKV